MDRRTYLVGVGTGAVAGCLGIGEEDEPQDDAGSDDERELPPVDSEPAVEETDDNGSTDDEEDDNRQETSDEIELERAIERAEDQYRLALVEFASHADGEDPTFLDVLPSTETEFNNAREHLDEARDILWSEAREFAHTEREQQRVREYRTYDDLIVKLYRVQRSIHRSYRQIDAPDERTTYSSKPSSLRSGTEDHAELGEEIADKELYMDDLQTKYEQQRWQLTLLDRTFSALVNIGSSRNISNRSTAELRFAREDLATVVTELEDPASAPPENRTDEAFLELAQEWYTLVDETLREN